MIIQVVEESAALSLYLNRPETLSPDSSEFSELLAAIQAVLVAKAPTLREVAVYSRPLGEEAIDYQHTLVMPAAEPTPSLPKNRSDFCFVRNRMLLAVEGDRPNAKVMESVQAFHRLPLAEQLLLLQVLADWLDDPSSLAERLSALPETGQTLMQSLQADKGFLRDMKIWLSRYCHNPEATIAFLQPPPPVVEPPPSREVVSDTTAVRRAGTRRSPPAAKEITVDISGLSAFRSQELPLIVGTAIVVGALSLAMGNVYALVGGWAVLITLASIGSGVATLLQQPILGGICLVVLIFCYPVSGAVIFVVPLASVGGLLGGILVFAMKMAAPRGGSIFSAQSLRLLIAAACVVLIVHGQAIAQYGLTGGKVPQIARSAPKDVLADHQASGTLRLNRRTFEFQSGFAVFSPREKALLVRPLSVPLTPKLLDDFLGRTPVNLGTFQRLTDEEGYRTLVAIGLKLKDPTLELEPGYTVGATWELSKENRRASGNRVMRQVNSELRVENMELTEKGRLKLSLKFDEGEASGFAVDLQLDSFIYVQSD
ncbi:MAG TPA: hypothetical protein DCQ32_00730 [Cyanobacteria bacterium UBA8156]|nr:hypothetical protein [Cyanobacteria bacterium UBA8156]